MGTLNNLVKFLVEDVSLSGSDGASVRDVLHSITQFYKSSSANLDAIPEQAIASSRNGQKVDRNFQKRAWTWLTRHPGITVGRAGEGNLLNLEQVEVQNADSSQPALKVYASEEQTWLAAAGHLRDYNKVTPKDFECLRVIASRREQGILQPDLVRITSQDKRSLPGRTDRLASRGYIQKIPIFAASKRTSLLLLAKFARPELSGQSQEPTIGIDTAANGVPTDQLQHYGHSRFSPYEDHIRRLMKMLEEELILKWDDIKKKLGVFEDTRTSKTLAEAVRRLEKLDILSRVRATSRISKNGDLHRCVKILREPLANDWDNFFERNGRFEIPSTSMDEIEDEPEFLFEWPEEEVLRAPEGYGANTLGFADLDHDSLGIPWDPDRSISHALRDAVDEGGIDGISLQHIKARTVGAFFSRPTDHIIERLVNHWELSQPLHLRHLGLIRDAAQSGKIGYYVHYTHGAFQTKVDRGEAVWNAVQTLQIPDTVSEMDMYGFNAVDVSQFYGAANNAVLRDCAQAPSGNSANGLLEKPGRKGLRVIDNGTIDDEQSPSNQHARSKKRAAKHSLHLSENPEINGPKKPRGRPRKYPLTDVASNARTLSPDELKNIKISQKRAFEYQLSKVKKDIAILVDEGKPESQAQRVALAEHRMPEQYFFAAQSAKQDHKSFRGRSRSEALYKPSLAAHGLVGCLRKRGAPRSSLKRRKPCHEPLHFDITLGYSPSCFSHGLFLAKTATVLPRASHSSTAVKSVSDELPYLPSIAAHDHHNARWLSKSVSIDKVGQPSIDKKRISRKRKSEEVDEGLLHQASIGNLPITAVEVLEALPYVPFIHAHDTHNATWLSRILPYGTVTQSIKRFKTDSRKKKARRLDEIFMTDVSNDAEISQAGKRFVKGKSLSLLTYQQQHAIIAGSGMGLFLGPSTTLKVQGGRGRPRKCRLMVIRCRDKGKLHAILTSTPEPSPHTLEKLLPLAEGSQSNPPVNSMRSFEDDGACIDWDESRDNAVMTSPQPLPALSTLSLPRDAPHQAIPSSETHSSKRGSASVEVADSDRPRKRVRFLEHQPEADTSYVELSKNEVTGQQNPHSPHFIEGQAQAYLVERDLDSCAPTKQKARKRQGKSLDRRYENQTRRLEFPQTEEEREKMSMRSEDHTHKQEDHLVLELREKAFIRQVPQLTSEQVYEPIQAFEQEYAVNEAFQSGLPDQQQGDVSPDPQTLQQSRELGRTQVNALPEYKTKARNVLQQTTQEVQNPEISPSPQDRSTVIDVEAPEEPEVTGKALATHREIAHQAPDDLRNIQQPEAIDPSKTHIQVARKIRSERGLVKTSTGKSLISSKVRRFGGSAAWTRREAMMDMIRSHNGVYCGSGIELLRGLTGVLSAKGITAVPDKKTVLEIKRTLISGGRIQEIHYTYQDKLGVMQTRSIVALSSIDPQDQAIKELQDTIKSCHPNPYIPDRSGSEPPPFAPTSEQLDIINPTPDKLYANRLPVEELPVKAFYPRRIDTVRTRKQKSPKHSPEPLQEDTSTGTDRDPPSRSHSESIEEEEDHRPALEFHYEYPGGAAPQAILIPIPTQVRFADDPEIIPSPPPKAQVPKALTKLPFIDLKGRRILWSPDNAYLSSVDIYTAPKGEPRRDQQSALFKSMVDHVASWEQKNPVESYSLKGDIWVHYRHPNGFLGFPKPVPILTAKNSNQSKRKPAEQTLPQKRKPVSNVIDNDQTKKKRRILSTQTKARSSIKPVAPNFGGSEEMKRVRLRGPRISNDFDYESDRALIVAVIITRTLLGGVDLSMDWDTVADMLDLRYRKMVLQRRWSALRVKFKSLISRLTSRFRDIFIQGYNAGVLPSLDYDNTESCDWNWLLKWATKELEISTGGLLKLPPSRGEFDARWDLDDLSDPDEVDFYELKQTSTIPQRHTWTHKSSRYQGTNIKRAKYSPSKSLKLAKNWIRANVMTPAITYRPDYARDKLSLLPEKSIDLAVSELLLERKITQENKGRATPARTYEMSDQFLSAFQFSLRPHHFSQAISFKKELDKTLEDSDSATFTRDPNDGQALALTNLMSHGMVVVSQAKLPSDRFGLTTSDYRTRALNKEKFNFDLIIAPTKQYEKGLPLKPLPAIPCIGLDGINNGKHEKFPVWIDINGDSVVELWDKALCAVLSLLTSAACGRTSFLESKLRLCLERYEIELVLGWLVDAGAAGWASTQHDGVQLKAWWWTILRLSD